MRLPRAGREFYNVPVNSVPDILFTAVQASFDNGATWHPPTRTPPGSVEWLITGPDLVVDDDDPDSIIVEHDVLVLLRAEDADQQVVIRPSSMIRLVDAAAILSVTDVLNSLTGVNLDDINDDDILVIEAAVADVVSDLTAYLGQPIVPTPVTLVISPYTDVEHTLNLYPGARDITYQADAVGRPTVRFVYGIDARFSQETAPIRGYLRKAVLNHSKVADLWRSKVGQAASRVVTSAGTEGQSVTFARVSPTGEIEKTNQYSRYNPEPDPRAALDYWRVAKRRVYQGAGYGSDPLGWYDLGVDPWGQRDTFVPWWP